MDPPPNIATMSPVRSRSKPRAVRKRARKEKTKLASALTSAPAHSHQKDVGRPAPKRAKAERTPVTVGHSPMGLVTNFDQPYPRATGTTTKFFVDTTKLFVVASHAAMTMPPRPTPAELEILRVLWEYGPSTVREVHDRLERQRPTGYTTVLKLLQIMADKDLVRRDETERAHVYAARVPEERTQRQLVRDLLDRAFGGSATKLVMHALSARKASPEELARIRALLDRLEGGER